MDKGSTANKTNSGISMMRTAADGENRSETRVTIWKELMKAKEDDQLSGHEKLPRSKIKEIRNKIRRDRDRLRSRKRPRKNGISMEMPRYSGAHTTYKAQSHSPDRSDMNIDRPKTVQALGNLKNSDALGNIHVQPDFNQTLPRQGVISVEQLRNQNYAQMQGEIDNFHSRQVQNEQTITVSGTDPYTTTSNNQTTIQDTLSPMTATGKDGLPPMPPTLTTQ